MDVLVPNDLCVVVRGWEITIGFIVSKALGMKMQIMAFAPPLDPRLPSSDQRLEFTYRYRAGG